jgi:hypothetical protein
MVVGDGGWRFGGSGGGGGYEYVPVVALPLPGRPPSPVCRGSQASKPTSSSTSNHKLLADISRRFHSRGVSPFWLTTVYMLSQIPDHSNKHVSQILDPQQPPHPPLTITGAPTNHRKKKKQKKENTHRGLGLASQQGRIYHLQENRHVLGQHAYIIFMYDPKGNLLGSSWCQRIYLSAKFSIQREWRCTECVGMMPPDKYNNNCSFNFQNHDHKSP